MRFSFLLLLVLVAACGPTKPPFDMDKADKLTPGVSTEADAKALFGNPLSMATGSDGRDLLMWQSPPEESANGTQILMISFDQNGKMLKIVQKIKS